MRVKREREIDRDKIVSDAVRDGEGVGVTVGGADKDPVVVTDGELGALRVGERVRVRVCVLLKPV